MPGARSERSFPWSKVVAGLVPGSLQAPVALAAHASATQSATATGIWGSTYGGAESNAEAAAYADLLSKATAAGYTTCINVTYSDTLTYIVPGGGDVFSSTATGTCGTEVFK
jgi:hypothetical protein